VGAIYESVLQLVTLIGVVITIILKFRNLHANVTLDSHKLTYSLPFSSWGDAYFQLLSINIIKIGRKIET
jgi:hypothetical protein